MAQAPQTPRVTADIIIELDSGGLVFIERAHPPLGVALPGGFVDVGESVEDAARREALEETNLEVELLDLLYVYSRPDRDPRGHTVSCVFIARADGTPKSGDDARRAFTAPADALPREFVFDHARILEDYLEFKRSGRRPRPGG